MQLNNKIGTGESSLLLGVDIDGGVDGLRDWLLTAPLISSDGSESGFLDDMALPQEVIAVLEKERIRYVRDLIHKSREYLKEKFRIALPCGAKKILKEIEGKIETNGLSFI